MKLINKLSFFNLGCTKEINIFKQDEKYRVTFVFAEDNEYKIIIDETYHQYSKAYTRLLDIKNQWFVL